MKYLEEKMGDTAEGPAPLWGVLRWGRGKPYGGYPRAPMKVVKEGKYPFRTKHENLRKLMDVVKKGKGPNFKAAAKTRRWLCTGLVHADLCHQGEVHAAGPRTQCDHAEPWGPCPLEQCLTL